jgi:hypothetical protein
MNTIILPEHHAMHDNDDIMTFGDTMKYRTCMCSISGPRTSGVGLRKVAQRALIAFLFGLLLLTVPLSNALAQESYSDLHLFGYMQGCYAMIDESILGPRSTTFLVQQANIMATKEFDSHFSTFVDLQFTNSYNSKLDWGALNLEEGWVKYSYNHAFNVKAGLIVPSFNAMLQVKNRTPLLPYIFRPFVYESIMLEVINLEPFLPVRANVEVYGKIPVGDLSLEYAAFLGNSESSYIVSGGSSFQVSGMDTTSYKLVGGRVGVTAPWMRAGLSMTSDRENHNSMGMGGLQRFRYGIDLSVHVSRFTLEGEGIYVRTLMDDREKGTLSMLRMYMPQLGDNFDRYFWYGTLLVDATDALFAYGSFSYLKVNDYIGMADGVREWSVGGGWRPIEDVVVKAQYVRVSSDSPVYDLKLGNTIIAVSVMF